MRLIAPLLFLVCSLTLTGCSLLQKEVALYPQTEQDIKIGDWCKPGWVCMSQDYVKYVMKVRIEEKAK